MKPAVIVLRFHTLDRDGERVCVAEAVDLDSGSAIASYSLGMMAGWLKKHGYRWRFGSSGIYEKVRAAA